MKATLTVALAAVSLLGASGCIVEQRIPDRAEVPAPPPPPADEYDAAPAPSPQAEAEVEGPAPGTQVDEEVFYTRLSPYGHWRWTPEYGRVWVPTVAYGWRPYTYGHWVLTDWGWTFVSDDPWGWAAYHYGSWAYGPAFGWYWVPGRVWAPAWVSWRWGGGYACWAPIGPAGYVYAYSSPAWVVVPQQHFTQPIVTYVVAPHAAAPIVAQTPPLAGPHAAPARGGQFGPPVPQVQNAVGHPIAAVPAHAVLRPVAVGPRGGGAGQPGFGRGGGAAQPGFDRGDGRQGPGARGDGRSGGPGPSAGPLRSPTPQVPPTSRPRYGVTNTGRPYGGPGGGGFGVPRGGGWGAPRAGGGAGVPRGNGSGGSAPRVGGGGGPRVSAPPAPAPAPSGGRGGGRGEDHHK